MFLNYGLYIFFFFWAFSVKPIPLTFNLSFLRWMRCCTELQPLQQQSSDFGLSWSFCFHGHICAGELFRQKINVKSNGYTKIADNPFTSATLSDSMQAEYYDKEVGQEDDEDEDEDIVYMGMDGIVYWKFKYSMLEGDEEREEEYLLYTLS